MIITYAIGVAVAIALVISVTIYLNGRRIYAALCAECKNRGMEIVNNVKSNEFTTPGDGWSCYGKYRLKNIVSGEMKIAEVFYAKRNGRYEFELEDDIG